MEASAPRRADATPHDDVLHVGGRAIPVRWRVHGRARRVKLAVDARSAGVIVTLPPGVTRRRGAALVAEHADWLAEKIAALAPRIPFADGAAIPLLGRETLIRHRPAARRGVWQEDGAICVSGRAEHLPRRLTDWLKDQALNEVAPRARAKAKALGREPGRVRVREMRSRWGSCSARGDLAFCWRLVLAPEGVLDYVVAHEVAHLREMNHGPRFWRTVAGLSAEVEGARAWLRRNGTLLHRYG